MSPFFPYVHVPSYQFGPFSFQIFGLSIALAVIVGATLGRQRAEALKLDFNLFIDSFFWVIPGGFILSHVVSTVLYYPERIVKDPLTLLYVWEGISSFGGFLGGFLVAFLYFKWKKVPVLVYMEALAYGLIAGFMVGRIGCAFAHDHPGMWLPAKLQTGMELAVTHVKVGGAYVQKIVSLPGVTSNAALWALLFFVVAAGLIASLISEKAFFSRIPIISMLGTAALFFLVYPMIPSLLRTFALPFPHKVSSDWAPGVWATYFNLQDLEVNLERKVLQELPLLLSPYFDLSTLQDPFLAKVPFEVTYPAAIVWGDFSYTATLVEPAFRKTYHVKTRMAYDLGMIEALYFIFFFIILTVLLKGKPRRSGFILALWFISYAPIRFLLDMLRVQELRLQGWTPGSYMALFTFGLGIFLYLNRLEQKAGDYVAPCNQPKENASEA